MKNSIKRTRILSVVLVLPILLLSSCSSEDPELGIGPVKEIKLAQIDQSLVSKGKLIFEQKCAACHQFDKRHVGPALNGVTKRRKPEWIMNMILNPEQMTKENMIAKNLLTEYMTQMTFQNVTQDDARALLEYFRSVDN